MNYAKKHCSSQDYCEHVTWLQALSLHISDDFTQSAVPHMWMPAVDIFQYTFMVRLMLTMAAIVIMVIAVYHVNWLNMCH